MKAETQVKILNLCKGKTIAQAEYRLEVMAQHIRNKQLLLRLRLANLALGA